MTRASQFSSTPTSLNPELDGNFADTSITAAALHEAQEAAARLLPAYWFKSHLRADVNNGQHHDNLTYVQTAGVPVGNYSIQRKLSRHFSLFCTAVETNQTGGSIERELGSFETMEAAVTAIRADLQWTASELQERANRWAAALAA